MEHGYEEEEEDRWEAVYSDEVARCREEEEKKRHTEKERRQEEQRQEAKHRREKEQRQEEKRRREEQQKVPRVNLTLLSSIPTTRRPGRPATRSATAKKRVILYFTSSTSY